MMQHTREKSTTGLRKLVGPGTIGNEVLAITIEAEMHMAARAREFLEDDRQEGGRLPVPLTDLAGRLAKHQLLVSCTKNIPVPDDHLDLSMTSLRVTRLDEYTLGDQSLGQFIE